MADSGFVIQNTFRRKEKKYLLTAEQAERMRRRLEPYMAVDRFGKTVIMSLYYDNDRYELIHRSIEKPRYKEKFRIRSYGVPGEDSRIFAEIKKKYDGIVYKRRVDGKLSDIREFLNTGAPLKAKRQIQSEILWMLERYELRPKTVLCYDRTAYTGRTDPELRITFDERLRYRTEDLFLEHGDRGEAFMPPGFTVMEVKFPGASPLWLSQILAEENILPGSFSKIGTCFQKRIFPEIRKENRTC